MGVDEKIMWHLTLYTKPECGLCDEAKNAISLFSAECGLRLEIVDITTDTKLFDTYRYEIPVLMLDGTEIARHHISLQKLRVIRKRLGGA